MDLPAWQLCWSIYGSSSRDKGSIDLLLCASRIRDDITLREYTGGAIAQCLRADKQNEEAQESAYHFISANVRTSTAVRCLFELVIPVKSDKKTDKKEKNP
jgi:hypothetical protein